jgi:HEPN domain-containing protein
MGTEDPTHWLYRLSPDDWLRAADNELGRAERALKDKHQRPGVAGARRAAGMALNGVLALADAVDERYGRSYMEHLRALAADAVVPKAVREAARDLIDAPLDTGLVLIGAGDTRLADAARAVVHYARQRVHAPKA